MMTNCGGAISHFGAIDETTKRLVGRCVGVEWLRDEQPEGKGLLGVKNERAMESSLSMVEVASQSEKRGVRTPSRLQSVDGNGVSVDVDVSSRGLECVEGNDVDVDVDVSPGGGEELKSPFEVEGEA